jgi:hypothetical protein
MSGDRIIEGNYGVEPNTDNAEKCNKSRKIIKNNSIYCNLLDQWVSVNYCAYACRAPEIKKQ